MNPDELALAIEQLIIAANQEYAKVIGAVERQLWKRMSTTLHKLQISDAGYILQNNENRAIIQQVQAQFDATVKNKVFEGALQEYVNKIPQLDALNATYFTNMMGKFVENRLFLGNIRKDTIATLESLILREGLTVNIERPLIGVVTKGINAGASFEGVREEVRQLCLGDQQNGGALQRYVTQITRDALFNYSRAYQQAASTDMGLEWFVWSGGLIKTSRPFCVARAEKYYHKQEIESWAAEDWTGKHKGTTEASIFVYAGGYNCAHTIIPVHETLVPAADKARVAKKEA